MDEKSRFINKIEEQYPGDKYGQCLIELMDYYHASNLRQLTLEELKDYLHIKGIRNE